MALPPRPVNDRPNVIVLASTILESEIGVACSPCVYVPLSAVPSSFSSKVTACGPPRPCVSPVHLPAKPAWPYASADTATTKAGTHNTFLIPSSLHDWRGPLPRAARRPPVSVVGRGSAVDGLYTFWPTLASPGDRSDRDEPPSGRHPSKRL